MIMRIKGINKVTAKGRVYYYLRKTGQRIKAEYGTAAFASEVAKLGTLKPGYRELPGTFGHIVERYRRSPEFSALKSRTKADYDNVLAWLRRMNDVPVYQIRTPDLIEVRDAALEERQFRFANYVVAVLSIVLTFGKQRGLCDDNPARDVPMIRRPKGLREQNRPWLEHEVIAALAAATPVVRAAICLAAFQGLRQGDVLSLSWNRVKAGEIDLRQNKTDDPLRHPLHSETAKALAALEKRGLLVITTDRKKEGVHTGYTGDGFRSVFARLITDLKQARKVGGGLTFHGLRHTFATEIANQGEDDKTVAAGTGHRSEAMVKKYTAHADKLKRANWAIAARERSWNK